MMNKMMLSLLLAACLSSCAPKQKFMVQCEEPDKYTQLKVTKAENNWVKSDQGYWVAFDFRLTEGKNGEGMDRFLVLKTRSGALLTGGGHFSIGKHLILDVDGEQIRLRPSCITVSGRVSSLTPGTFEDAVLIDDETFNKLTDAKEIAFQLQGSKYAPLPELTGSFNEGAVENLRALRRELL